MKINFEIMCAAVVPLLGTLLWEQPISAQEPAPTDLASFVKYVQSHHRAPFDRDGVVLPKGKVLKIRTNAPLAKGSNVKVNRDRDPWPKAEIAGAVDPTSGNNYVVMSNDFRENYNHMFYHVSTTNGATWTDDSMVGGADPVTGFIPLTFQSDPGVAFDTAGHSFLSTITGNLIFDFVNNYINMDTEIELAQGFGNGTYTSLLPTAIDDEPCNGSFSTVNCPGSPNKSTIYFYYTLFCNGKRCVDGNATVPPFSSAILESHSRGAGLPFSAPRLVSGSLTQEQFSDMVIDSHGTPHIFFDDFSGPFTTMWESTLQGGKWVVGNKPVATFVYNGLNNMRSEERR